jgi:AcrR family transcriptional regulator
VRTATRASRPANRRDLILDAAAELFTRRGYSNVSMSDIADKVEVRPSALYRHFPGKDGLLSATVDQALDRLDQALGDTREEAVPRAQVLGRLADFSWQHRSAALLWEREARHLPTASDTARARLDGVRDAFTRAVSPAGEPTPARRCASRMAFAILLSPAFHRATLPDGPYRRVLVDAAVNVLDAGIDAEVAPATAPEAADGSPASGLRRATKREQILQAALHIFAEQTYASASMEQIAGSVGMTASSLYNHFGSKTEILEVALHRGNGYLQVTLDDVLQDARDEASALRNLVGVYTSFALRHPGLVDALLTEIGSLRDDADTLLQAQREYVSDWVRLYEAARPDLAPGEAVFAVQAVLAAVNEITRDPRLRTSPGTARLVTGFALAALQLSERGD